MISMVPIYPREAPQTVPIVDVFGVTHTITLPSSFWVLGADNLLHEFHIPKQHVIKAGTDRFVEVIVLERPTNADPDLVQFPVPSTKGEGLLRVAGESVLTLN